MRALIALDGCRPSQQNKNIGVAVDHENVSMLTDVAESLALLFVKESRIAARPSEVFAFHEAPGALVQLTPPWEKIRIIEGGGSLQPGTRVVLETRIGPFPVRWIAEHTEYVRDSMFADRQISGPFASWYHRHRFLDDGAGGTILRDEVEYEPPLGMLGRMLATDFIERKLTRMFDYRHNQTKSALESNKD